MLKKLIQSLFIPRIILESYHRTGIKSQRTFDAIIAAWRAKLQEILFYVDTHCIQIDRTLRILHQLLKPDNHHLARFQ